MMQRLLLISSIGAMAFSVVLYPESFAQEAAKVQAEDTAKLREELEVLKKDRDNLLAQVTTLKEQQAKDVGSKEYEELKRDRDNILAQVQALLKEKGQIKELKSEITKQTFYNEKLKNDKRVLLSKIEELEDQIKKLHEKNLAEIEKQERLKKDIENMKIEYKMVDEIKAKLKESEQRCARLERQMREMKNDFQKAQSAKLEAKAASEVYRRQIHDLKKQLNEAYATNKALERKLNNVPKKFAEIARENKVLLRETALMHYNLGVFYTENQEYRRALAELEKALELNPDDAYSHFNIGYIYAEYVVDRKKAIEHFRKYLRLAKKDDKDIDWVKKYILTWQAWDAKRPLK